MATTDFCNFCGSHLISWKSKKQVVISRISTETEYRAIVLGTCEIIWLHYILEEVRFPEKNSYVLHCDNKSDIQPASDLVLHERTKHIEIDVHFSREKVRHEIITPSLVSLEEQVTKLLVLVLFALLLTTWLDRYLLSSLRGSVVMYMLLT